jgi:hypothetical protein
MFKINKDSKKLNKVVDTKFSDIGLKERKDLQEWISNNPEILGEELLIIQKEYSGFSDTNERLDLLALDKSKNLVVIENKLDDSGKDVVWQALKYVSYCSTLDTKEIIQIYEEYLKSQNIKENAETKIRRFLGVDDREELLLNELDQRIILVSGNFRKEVTSTALWLIQHEVEISLKKVTPYFIDGIYLVDLNQIIPTKEVADYQIKLAKKQEKDMEIKKEISKTELLRIEFWNEVLKSFNRVTDYFQNVSASQNHWLSAGAGSSGVVYSFVITKSRASVEIIFHIPGEPSKNKRNFNKIKEKKDIIENKFGDKLDWEEMPESVSSRVAFYLNDINFLNKDEWPKILNFYNDKMKRLIDSTNFDIKNLNNK